MGNENETCGICSVPYDTKYHCPRVLINCGHTLCSSCLIGILKSPQLRACPFDDILFKRSQDSLDHFPINFALSALLEGKNRNTCQIHDDHLTIVCLKDRIKICRDCALFGEHKGHPMKSVKELKAQRNKMRTDLEESLSMFKKFQLEKDKEVDVLEEEFLREMKNKFKEIRDMLKAKQFKWIKETENIFERNIGRANEQLLTNEAEKILEEIDQACRNEENLDALDQDFSSIMSRLQTPAGEEKVLDLLIESSRVMDCLNIFFMDQANSIKSFDLLNERKKMEQKENLIGVEEKSPGFFKTQTLCDTGLFIRVNSPNLMELPVNLDAYNQIERVSIELNQYDSLLKSSVDLSEIFPQPNNLTSLAVSFAPEGLTDDYAINFLNLLFCKIQHLIEIEISFEQCEITDKPIIFFCNNLLPKATSLTNLTLPLGSTLLSNKSLFALATSLFPLSRNLEIFTFGAGHTNITDNGIEDIFPALWEVKELNLQLQGTLVTDSSFKELGKQMTLFMEKLTLIAMETQISIEGISAIFAGIPKRIKSLKLDFL